MFDGLGRILIRQHLRSALAILALGTLAGCGAAPPQVAPLEAPTLPPEPTATPFVVPPTSTTALPVAASPTSVPLPTATAVPTVAAPSVRVVPPDPETGVSQMYEKGTSGRMEIALTFDAGADRGNGEAILDRLAAYEVPASFGVTGQWAEANPDLIQRMVADGHNVFNHSWSHSSWTGRSTSADPEDPSTWTPLPYEARLEELHRTEQVIREIANYEVRPYYRPPYGDIDSESLEVLAEAGYHATVMWSCESFAWKGWTAAQIVSYCTTNMAPGDIILLHVGAQGADYDALPGLIEGLRAQGFAFVTIEQILQP